MNAGLAIDRGVAVIRLNPTSVKIKLRRGFVLVIGRIEARKFRLTSRADRQSAMFTNDVSEHPARFCVTVCRV